MKIEKSTTVISLSESDLKEAIEYWLMAVHNQRIEIKHLEHLVGSCEIDTPCQDGVKLQVVDLPDLTYRH